MFQFPYHSVSDASSLQTRKHMKTLSNQIKHALPVAGGSADNLLSASNSPSGSINKLPTEPAADKSGKFMAFKNPKGHSHSTGDLNKRFNLAPFNDIQTNDSQFFEVMYIGKIKVSHKKVPATFIDDAIPKFKAHDAEKMKNLTKEPELQHQNISDSFIVQNDLKIILTEPNVSGSSNSAESPKVEKSVNIEETHSEDELKENDVPTRNRSASIGAVPKNHHLTQLNRPENRTMVFLLSRHDIRLISLNRKQILLHKFFVDVLNCVQGVKNGDHFGVICKESAYKDEYIGYVFKCQSDSIALDIVASVSKSFAAALAKLDLDQNQNNVEDEEEHHTSELLTCEHCPVVWYNRLCTAIDGLGDKRTFNTIVRHTETLSDDDQDNIMEKFYGADKVHEYTQKEKNEFLLALLEAHCQLKQIRHIHDSAENRSEFLNQHLGGSTIFTKARRSLTNSFDNLLKRRSSKDITDGNNNLSQGSEPEDQKYKPTRSVSLNDAEPKPKRLNSANMDIFFKVGNNPKENKTSDSSWRQTILNKVRDPSKESEFDSTMKLLPAVLKKNQPLEKKTKEDYRELWNIAIKQIVLLIRMEKENAQLQKRHNFHEIKRIKLEYDEIMPIDRQLSDVWDNFIVQHSTSPISDPKIFLQAIKSGVPRAKRGDVWMLLAEQFNNKTAPIDSTVFPNINMNYIDLLKNLTEHQHAIFMDISRTFPNHEYFKVPFGLGQLSLFNLLKAYSILDPELGYCQGLAFICGVLLLHLREKDAFYLLKHLMFKRKMRQRYLPDMKDFQLQLYQVCRLIKDYLPDLYQLFDDNEVTPTIYAAPWILTIFSSSFPLGFVARVFDLLFFASDEVIFRVVLALLDVHKDDLMKLDCFEDIMDYLKNIVPQMEQSIMNKVFKKVYSLSISRQLADYHIEYNVLKEEITMQIQNLASLNCVKETNINLEKQLQVTQSNIDRLENLRHGQQHENQLLQMQVQTLQVTIQTLGDFLTNLAIQRNDIDLPSDIRRVLQQLEFQQRQQKKRPVFLDRKIGKSVSDLGAGLKVLLEQNENELAVGTGHNNVPTDKKKYFQNNYNQIKQKSVNQTEQENSLNQIKETAAVVTCPEKSVDNYKMKIDEENITTEIELKDSVVTISDDHPLSSQDIHFTFNTLELKSLTPRISKN